jgi:hypothetical protein
MRVRPLVKRPAEDIPPEDESEFQGGEWSDIASVNTFDAQGLESDSIGMHAILVKKGETSVINFEKPGMVKATQGYSFGIHYWKIRIDFSMSYNYHKDASGLMIVGVVTQKSKLNGSTVYYSDSKGKFEVYVRLDAD